MEARINRSTRLLGLAFIVAQLAIYGWIALLSIRFDFHSDGATRPILLVVALFTLNFVLHLLSLRLSLKHEVTTTLVVKLIAVAIMMRMIMLVSFPIQEVDIYRYQWDGIVSSHGVNPFRFSPAEVLLPRLPQLENIASAERTNSEDELVQLQRIAFQDHGIRESLARVHFPELPTVYPPISQAVFALANLVTPAHSSIIIRTLIMKSLIVTFDLGVLLILWRLLVVTGKHPAWMIVYGWSPLVLKEYANSGHLDAIALVLMIGAIVLLPDLGIVDHDNADVRRYRIWKLLASAIALGLGVGAKLFPLLLFPLIAVFVWRNRGIRWGGLWLSLALAVATVSLIPMFATGPGASSPSLTPMAIATEVQPNSAVPSSEQSSLNGLSLFLTKWEMNDLIFMVIEENLRPEGVVVGQPMLWFTITPDRFRHWTVAVAEEWLGVSSERAPFLLARALTLAIFLFLTGWLCLITYRTPHDFLGCCFLGVAWFWLLAPTQNPWYWTWVLPLAVYAKSRVWLGISGLTMAYYLRFWFLYQAGPTEVNASGILGTHYRGVAFYDFVLTWIEFGPFLILLLMGWLRSRKQPCSYSNLPREKIPEML